MNTAWNYEVKDIGPEQRPASFSTLYEAQYELMENLVKANKLRQLETDLETREGQVLFRTVIAELIEEIGEFYSAVSELDITLLSPSVSPEKIYQHGVAIENELGDIMAFLMELYVFVGMDEPNLMKAIEEAMTQHDLEFVTPDPLEIIYLIAQTENHMDKASVPPDVLAQFQLGGRRLAKEYKLSLYYSSILDTYKSMDIMAEAGLFIVIHKLTSARNSLKAKPWKIDFSDSEPDVAISMVLTATKALFAVLSYLDISYEVIMQAAHKKNLINLQRIKNAY